jgi:hypothetical protein
MRKESPASFLGTPLKGGRGPVHPLTLGLESHRRMKRGRPSPFTKGVPEGRGIFFGLISIRL